MSGEIKSWWQARIAELERDRFFKKRYADCAKEPKALYDRIGEDLDSSNESIRNAACWVLLHLTPELINLLHEKETRNPGWKDKEGKDQKMVNEGLDGSKCILKHLHTKFVKEHRFKVLDGKKDPRPFLKKIIKNWEGDEKRKREREVPLDYEAALEIPDPAGSPEDYIINTKTRDDLWIEYKSYFKDRDGFNLFYTFNVDDSPLEEIRERWDIPSDADIRQRKSRINKAMVARRDASFTLLLNSLHFQEYGTLPRSRWDPEMSEWQAERVKRSVWPRGWLNGVVANGESAVAICPLTSPLQKTPGHIYLVATKKDQHKTIVEDNPLGLGICNGSRYTLDSHAEYVGKMINLKRGYYLIRIYDSPYPGYRPGYPTEVPGINDALNEVSVDYYVWLISCLPNPHCRVVEVKMLALKILALLEGCY